MKTPKRITYCGCGCALNLDSTTIEVDGKDKNIAALFCPKCGAEYRGEAFAARCIRKNREKRLRNLIHWQAEDIKWFKGTLKERTEARDWLVVCYSELARKHDLEGAPSMQAAPSAKI